MRSGGRGTTRRPNLGRRTRTLTFFRLGNGHASRSKVGLNYFIVSLGIYASAARTPFCSPRTIKSLNLNLPRSLDRYGCATGLPPIAEQPLRWLSCVQLPWPEL